MENAVRRATRLQTAVASSSSLDALPGATLYVPTPQELLTSIDYFTSLADMPPDASLAITRDQRNVANRVLVGSHEYAMCVASLWRVHEKLVQKLRDSPNRVRNELKVLEERRAALAAEGYGYFGPPYFRTVGYEAMVENGVDVFGHGERSLLDFTKKLMKALPDLKRIADSKGDKRQGDKAATSHQRIATELSMHSVTSADTPHMRTLYSADFDG